jgi:DNA end-binding protein Ku
MAAHAIWTGSISFGLVTIPVALRSATQEHDLKFSMLDKHDLAPIGYKHINKKSGKEVVWADIVKGYEYADDKYVVLKPEDFEKANVKASKIIEIEDFVELSEIDPVYLETPYYVVPQAAGAKAYKLLLAALKNTQKVGIGRVVLHTKYRLVAVLPMDDLLVLEILRFPHEIRSDKDLDLPAGAKGAKGNDKELAMAEQLIDGLTSKWNPSKYKDTYHDDLLRLIKNKIKRGATAEIEPYNEPDEEPSTGKGKVIDLMPLLRASLERGRSGGSAKAASKTKAKATTKAKAKATTKASAKAAPKRATAAKKTPKATAPKRRAANG